MAEIGPEPALPIVDEAVQSPGQSLPADVRESFESRFGHDFGSVRVHTDARAAASADAVQAESYTVGRHIVLAEGRYAPTTPWGRRLLAHELTHVVQQSGGSNRQPHSDLSAAAAESEARLNAAASGGEGPMTVASRTPQVLMRQQRTEATPQEIKRDDLFRELAARPGEAFPLWRRLKPAEQTVLVTYMTMLYGVQFAQRFLSEVKRRPRPELVITITNVPTATPARLHAAGYRLATHLSPALEVWVHPSGSETWVIRTQPQAPPPPESPNVAEVRMNAEDNEAARASLIDVLARVKARVGTAEYRGEFDRLFAEFNDFQQQLLEDRNALAELRKSIDPKERDAFEAQALRLEELERWRLEFLRGELVRLPAPGSAGGTIP